jgi:hypothetical protein
MVPKDPDEDLHLYRDKIVPVEVVERGAASRATEETVGIRSPESGSQAADHGSRIRHGRKSELAKGPFHK